MLKALLGVNRRRYGIPAGDLTGLDGVAPNRRPFLQIKSRGPRQLRIGPHSYATVPQYRRMALSGPGAIQ